MGYARLILVSSIAIISGCSSLIARKGIDLGALNTRQDVRERLGEPVATGITNEKSFDEFRTRRKIADPMRANGLGLAFCFTLGSAEVLNFPSELLYLGTTTALGQDVRFIYDDSNKVTAVFVEGERQSFLLKPNLEYRSVTRDE